MTKEDFATLRSTVRAVPVPDAVVDYAVGLCTHSRPDNDSACEAVKNYVSFGAGPRGSQNLVLAAKARALLLVRTQALRRLGQTASKFRETFETDYGPVFVLQFNEELPGVWYSRRPLPKQPLDTLSELDTDDGKIAKILLLAIKGEVQQYEEIESDINTEATQLLICTSLSLAERVDPVAIRIFQQVVEKLTEEQSARAFYSLIHNLPGEEVRTIRADLRKKLGANVFDTSP